MGEGMRSGTADRCDGGTAERPRNYQEYRRKVLMSDVITDGFRDGKTFRKGERYRSIVDVLADLRTRSAVLLAVEGETPQIIHSWAIMRTRVLELLAVIDGGLLYRAEEV